MKIVTFLYCAILAVIFLCITFNAMAQTPDEPGSGLTPEATQPVQAMTGNSMIRFSALVQFVEGFAERIDAQGTRTPMTHRFVIYEGERFRVEPNATLKIVTRSECTAVIYGPAQAASPEMEKPWRIRAESLRWICPPGKEEMFLTREAVFEVGRPLSGSAASELLIDSRSILVLRGDVTAAGEGPLPRMKVLERRGGRWFPKSSDTALVWNFNQRRRPPQESLKLSPPSSTPPPSKPDQPKTLRWILGPTIGAASANYDVKALDDKSVDLDGARFQLQAKRGNGSLIIMLEALGLDKKSENGSPNTPPPDGVRTKGNQYSFFLGQRFQHERWWSPFWRVGLGLTKTRLFVNKSVENYHTDTEYEFYMIRAATGIDAKYSPRFLNSFGIYGGAEITLARSIARGGRFSNHEFIFSAKPAEAEEPWSLTMTTLQLMLGLFLQY